jgi:sirohydrochlorin ferrochelatase
MIDETLLLIGRDTEHARDVFETHAQRLRNSGVVDDIRVVLYENDPVSELGDRLDSIAVDVVYALPFVVAHSYETINAIPAALTAVSGDVCYCEPIGRSPAVTDVLTDRASEQLSPGREASVVLVGFGNSSQSYQRQVVEYHAARVRDRTTYDEVVTSYLIQDPAVECARYDVSTDRSVAVPVFVSRNEATETEIPAKLELDRGGMRYAEPLGAHQQLTSAIHAEVEKQRVLRRAGTGKSIRDRNGAETQRVVTDGGSG